MVPTEANLSNPGPLMFETAGIFPRIMNTQPKCSSVMPTPYSLQCLIADAKAGDWRHLREQILKEISNVCMESCMGSELPS